MVYTRQSRICYKYDNSVADTFSGGAAFVIETIPGPLLVIDSLPVSVPLKFTLPPVAAAKVTALFKAIAPEHVLVPPTLSPH